MDDGTGTRAAIGRALLELLAEGRTVSYGAAAARAGVSKGLVQHHFPNRAVLIRFAATTLADRLRERLGASVPSAADGTGSPAAVLAGILTALLPTSAEARLDEAAGRALFALALTDPETNVAYKAGRRQIAALLHGLLAAAAPDRDRAWVERTARDLLGTLTEVATDLLLGDRSAADAEEVLRARVALAVGG